jgi:hypothetical protein
MGSYGTGSRRTLIGKPYEFYEYRELEYSAGD